MFERVAQLTDSLLALVPGNEVIIYKDGQCVLRHRAGYRDVEKTQPIDGTEIYNIYSCSKIITCVAAMQLWEQGRFQLTDKLSDYMPEFAEMTVQTEGGIVPANGPIRIHHLFEMTAGFSYNLKSRAVLDCQKDTDGRCPTREFMRYLAKEPLGFHPGEKYRYSLCHDVLAALVEVIAGQPFEDYVQANICIPVGMKNTTFFGTATCPGYIYNKEQNKLLPVENNYRIGTEYASGGAGAVSTVDDYIAFMEALRTGKLLKPETVELMATDRLTDAQKVEYQYPTTKGYGLGLRTPKAGLPQTEYGWAGAAGAFVAIDPVHNLSVFYVQHVRNRLKASLRNQVYSLAFDELTGLHTADVSECPALQNWTL